MVVIFFSSSSYYYYYYYLLLLLLSFIWKTGRNMESSFTPQMLATMETGPHRSQEPGTQSRSLMWMAREPSPTDSQGRHEQEAGMENGVGTESQALQDGLTTGAHSPCPAFSCSKAQKITRDLRDLCSKRNSQAIWCPSHDPIQWLMHQLTQLS